MHPYGVRVFKKGLKLDGIFRVVIKTTGSLHPCNTFWSREVAYCGDSLKDARIAFLRSEAEDYGGSYGNRCRTTEIERFEAEPEEIDITECEAVGFEGV